MAVPNGQVDKLPKWAQEYISDLQRERDASVRQLNEYCDSQTPSAFYIDDYVSTGEKRGPSSKRQYIQTSRITVLHEGVELDILVRDGDGIDLQWSDASRTTSNITMVPWSFQKIKLIRHP